MAAKRNRRPTNLQWNYRTADLTREYTWATPAEFAAADIGRVECTRRRYAIYNVAGDRSEYDWTYFGTLVEARLNVENIVREKMGKPAREKKTRVVDPNRPRKPSTKWAISGEKYGGYTLSNVPAPLVLEDVLEQITVSVTNRYSSRYRITVVGKRSERVFSEDVYRMDYVRARLQEVLPGLLQQEQDWTPPTETIPEQMVERLACVIDENDPRMRERDTDTRSYGQRTLDNAFDAVMDAVTRHGGTACVDAKVYGIDNVQNALAGAALESAPPDLDRYYQRSELVVGPALTGAGLGAILDERAKQAPIPEDRSAGNHRAWGLLGPSGDAQIFDSPTARREAMLAMYPENPPDTPPRNTVEYGEYLRDMAMNRKSDSYAHERDQS